MEDARGKTTPVAALINLARFIRKPRLEQAKWRKIQGMNKKNEAIPAALR
jgi:TnpA family transposase